MAFVYISTYNRLLSYILVHIIDWLSYILVHIIDGFGIYNRYLSYILVHIIDGFRIY